MSAPRLPGKNRVTPRREWHGRPAAPRIILNGFVATFHLRQFGDMVSLAGVALMHMIKKRQLMVEAGDEGLTAVAQFYALAASSLHQQGQRFLHDFLSQICDTTKPTTPRDA